ncbi:MAG: hypothetical protein P8J14_06005 [Emcibacteraceae bacterium]|nr:hypothetical protein [Emcibacteraceae bacterium]
MSKVGVSLKINVSQIDKARLFKGQKGAYLDATVFIDLDQLDQYGNSGMITQDVTKAEKDQGVKGNILGNCKVFWSEQSQAPQQAQQAPQQQQAYQPQQPVQQAPVQQVPPHTGALPVDNWDDDLPF